MDGYTNKKYDRVMPRVYNQSRSTLKSSSSVMRHEKPLTGRVGAKPSVSNNNSSIISELPTVLNDYIPEKTTKHTFVVKPRRTIKSLDPPKSPIKKVRNELRDKPCNLKVRGSAPSVRDRDTEGWSDSHLRQCFTSRPHIKLKELKDEIKAYHETEKMMKLRSQLYKNCGVVLDDVGNVAEDKAAQAEIEDQDEVQKELRTSVGEDAGTPVLNEQMRPASSRYPVDRYLVESSKKFEMVNIIEDEIWNPEPALRPEDEIILRKLHEMLQSTAEDLKQLSGELSKFHEPGVQVKTLPTPLDEEFNEKVHIEEVVNAKFHGYKIIDTKSPHLSDNKLQNNMMDVLTTGTRNLQKPEVVNTGVQVNTASILKKPVASKRLGITRTKIMQINENNEGEELRKDYKNVERLNNGKVIKTTPAVTYDEFIYKYTEPKVPNTKQQSFQIQEMPKINIRSELQEQKVLQLDILPETKASKANIDSKSNVAVVVIEHDTMPVPTPIPTATMSYHSTQEIKQPTRKISKMTTCESSESTTNISSDARHKLKTYKQVKAVLKLSPRSTPRIDRTKLQTKKKESEKRTLDEWKRKLNSVYGQSSNSRNNKSSANRKEIKRVSPKKQSTLAADSKKSKPNILNNSEYIPYSQLTLGGVRLSDIERELSDIPNKNNLPLSPILDKILSSRENSFHNDSPKRKGNSSPKILTTSDENLLQEVVDIERTVKDTISQNEKKSKSTIIKSQNISSESNLGDDYADDFEGEKSDNIDSSKQTYSNHTDSKISDISIHKSINSDNDKRVAHQNKGKQNEHNITYTKTSNLSFKNSVDVFEFIHSVDTHDTATQSNTTHKISLKETQTSPRNETPNIQPIHNDLWPSIDPQGKVEELFKLEKDFIKKLIIDEYSDLLEKNLTKPSTSKDSRDFENSDKNVAAYQKNTQTSPAHVKSVMTSPRSTKTRTTSPFKLSLSVEQQTSPLIFVTNEEEVKLEIENAEDVGISINLSSPRFSLRLPQTSREVISNLDGCSRTPSNVDPNENKSKESTTSRKNVVSSSSSIDGDRSSSEISSLGEVKLKLKRRLRKNRISSISESSFSSTVSKYSSDLQLGGILPLRSEGEISLGQNLRDKSRKSDGETSFGPLLD